MATSRTADPQAKALNSARTRALTAAKKSLGLIAEAVARHQADLEAGNVPDATFTASVLKYEGQRSVLEAFGKLAGGEPAEPEPASDAPVDGVVVSQADLAAFIRYLAEFQVPLPDGSVVKALPDNWVVSPDSALGRLRLAAQNGTEDATQPQQAP